MFLKLFAISIPAFIENESIFILYLGKKIKLYSKKGQSRDETYLEGLVREKKPVLFVAPRPPWIKAIPHLVWLDPFSQKKIQEDHIATEKDWRNFLQSFTKEQTFTLLVHPLLPNKEEILELVKHDLEEAAIRLKTIHFFDKIWEWNFKLNLKLWLKTADFYHLSLLPPNAIVLGGPQVDENWEKIKIAGEIWAADTALMPLLGRGIIPRLIASVDARSATMEHFAILLTKKISQEKLANSYLLLDPLAFPALYRLKEFKKVSYRSSHPLVQKTMSHHSELFNERGDVFGLLLALFKNLFPQKALPPIFGGEYKASFGISHLRGSGYLFYHLRKQNRFFPFEMYSYSLSKRYLCKKAN